MANYGRILAAVQGGSDLVMKLRAWLVAVFAFVVACGLFPGIVYAADNSTGSGLAAGEIEKAPTPIKPQSLKAQGMSYVDGGYTGSCDWDIFLDDGWYYLFISPSNGSYGWIESVYYDESTNGSTAPWYPYSDYIRGISISEYVLASESCNCMFCDCPNLQWVDLSGLDTSDVTDMSNMFFGCGSLSTIWVTTLWSTANVQYSAGMFYGCYNLEGGNGTALDTGYYEYDTALWANIDYPDNPGYFTSLYLGDATVTLSGTSFTYDANAKTPGVTVSIGIDTLENGSDYTVSYTNNVNAGTATVDIVPASDSVYQGSASTTFTINRANISSASVTLSKTSLPYTGKARKPVPKAKLGGRVLSSKSDYAVSYKNNVNAGTAKITLTGKGNYTGSKTVAFKVKAAPNSAKAAKTGVKKTLKYSSVKKAATYIALPKVTAKFGKAKWKVASKDKKKVLSLSGSKVKVKKGAKKGTYTIKLKAQVAKTRNYGAAVTKVVTVKVVVK